MTLGRLSIDRYMSVRHFATWNTRSPTDLDCSTRYLERRPALHPKRIWVPQMCRLRRSPQTSAPAVPSINCPACWNAVSASGSVHSGHQPICLCARQHLPWALLLPGRAMTRKKSRATAWASALGTPSRTMTAATKAASRRTKTKATDAARASSRCLLSMAVMTARLLLELFRFGRPGCQYILQDGNGQDEDKEGVGERSEQRPQPDETWLFLKVLLPPEEPVIVLCC